MKTKLAIFLVLMLVGSIGCTFVTADEYEPLAGPNYMGFATANQHRTIGDSFTVTAWADIHYGIRTVAIDNMTFLPAGVLGYTPPTPVGNLWASPTIQINPEDGPPAGVINNASGWLKAIVRAKVGTPLNNTNGTLTTMTWLATGCGMVTLNITAGGTATEIPGMGGVDPGTDKYPLDIWVHPMAVTGFSANMYNTTQINLTWTKQTGDDKTLIRYKTGSNPTSVIDGTLLYNGTGASTEHSGLSPGDHIYYSAWGWNETGSLYSLTYDTDDEATNSPPVFGTPTPNDGAINQNLALTWSISITDPETDLIDWEIECSNSQRNSANNAVGGTKSLSISGLEYSTLYTVYVNATDDGSGTWTRDTFTFTTKANSPPSVPDGDTDIIPVNNAPNVPVSVGFLRVVVSDPNGDTMSVSFYWGNTTLIGTDTGVISGETASITIPRLEYNTTYYWYVSINDGHGGITRGPVAGNWTYTTKEEEVGVPTPTSFNTIYFVVVDDANNNPIANAVIKVYDEYGTPNEDLQDTGTTDLYGTWSDKFKSNKIYTAVVDASGYQTKIQAISLDGVDVYVTIRMTAGAVAPVGLTDANGLLTTYGYIALVVIAVSLLAVAYLWYGNKKR